MTGPSRPTTAIESARAPWTLLALLLVLVPDAGSFVLLASALGYGETRAGVFELGDGGSMEIEYRLRPEPLPIDEVLVELARPTLEHHLVRNGFVRRFQRGLGTFITPYDIEHSVARTESLMMGIPGVRVGSVTEVSSGSIEGVNGIWTEYYPELGATLTQYARIGDVEAIEIYRRAAEIPVEYPIHTASVGGPDGPRGRDCGVLVVWTKTGLAPGQRPATARRDVIPGVPLPDLPFPVDRDVGLSGGQRIRMEIAAPVAKSKGLETPWQGTFVAVLDQDLVAEDPLLGRAVSVPLAAIQVLQVEQPRGEGHAYLRGAVAGAAFRPACTRCSGSSVAA